MRSDLSTRAQDAIRVMQDTRAELRAILAPGGELPAQFDANEFPRSKTLRWMLTHPLGRWLGSALLARALIRLPLGRLVATWAFGRGA